MKKTRFKYAACVALISVSALSSAMAAYDLVAIKKLVEQQQFAKAYEQASVYLEEMAGDPGFDFWYGLAAVDSGHINQGIFAFERILMLQPAHLRARLELGRAYFLLGEDARSRKEFQRVLDSNPPATVAANVQKYMDAIRLREKRYTTSASGYVEAGVGYDSNVNSATADSQITFFGIPLVLDSTSLERSDQFSFTSVGAQVNHPVAPGEAWFGRLDAAKRFYDQEEASETHFANLQAGKSWLREKTNYRLSLISQSMYVNDQSYRDSYGINTELSRVISERSRVSAAVGVTELYYPGQSARGAMQYVLSLAGTRLYGTRFSPLLNASLQLGHEAADEEAHKDVAERDFYGLQLSSRLLLSPSFSSTLSIGAQNSTYGAIQRAFGLTRSDDIYTAGIRFVNYVKENWSLNASIDYIRNDSNITLYDFEREQYQLSVRREF